MSQERDLLRRYVELNDRTQAVNQAARSEVEDEDAFMDEVTKLGSDYDALFGESRALLATPDEPDPRLAAAEQMAAVARESVLHGMHEPGCSTTPVIIYGSLLAEAKKCDCYKTRLAAALAAWEKAQEVQR